MAVKPITINPLTFDGITFNKAYVYFGMPAPSSNWFVYDRSISGEEPSGTGICTVGIVDLPWTNTEFDATSNFAIYIVPLTAEYKYPSFSRGNIYARKDGYSNTYCQVNNSGHVGIGSYTLTNDYNAVDIYFTTNNIVSGGITLQDFQWGLTSYGVSYNANGGTITAGGQTYDVYTYTGRMFPSISVSRSNCTFVRWFDENGNTVAATSGSAIPNDLRLNAEWLENGGDSDIGTVYAKLVSATDATKIVGKGKVVSHEYTEQITQEGMFHFGSVVHSMLTITAYDDEYLFDNGFRTFDYYQTDYLGNEQFINRFILSEINIEKGKTTIVAYDMGTMLDAMIGSLVLSETKTAGLFPITAVNLVKRVLAKVGNDFQLASEAFPGNNYTINECYASELTGTELLSMIAELCSCWVTVKYNKTINKCVVSFTQTPTQNNNVVLSTDSSYTEEGKTVLPAFEYDIGTQQRYGPSVKVSATESDVGVIYPTNYTDENSYMYTISNNLMLTGKTSAEMSTIAQNTFLLLNYQDFPWCWDGSIRIPRTNLIHAGDYIKCINGDDEPIYLFVMKLELTPNGTVLTQYNIFDTAVGTSAISRKYGSITERMMSLDVNNEGIKARMETSEGDIHDLQVTAEGLDERLEDAEGSITQLSVKAGKVDLVVQDGSTASSIQITPGFITAALQALHIQGAVLVGDLTASGTTVIDGARISTGQINAARLDVSGIFAEDIVATGSITGAVLIGSAFATVSSYNIRAVVDQGMVYFANDNNSESVAKLYASVLSHTNEKTLHITDADKVVASAKVEAKDYKMDGTGENSGFVRQLYSGTSPWWSETTEKEIANKGQVVLLTFSLGTAAKAQVTITIDQLATSESAADQFVVNNDTNMLTFKVWKSTGTSRDIHIIGSTRLMSAGGLLLAQSIL